MATSPRSPARTRVVVPHGPDELTPPSTCPSMTFDRTRRPRATREPSPGFTPDQAGTRALRYPPDHHMGRGVARAGSADRYDSPHCSTRVLSACSDVPVSLSRSDQSREGPDQECGGWAGSAPADARRRSPRRAERLSLCCLPPRTAGSSSPHRRRAWTEADLSRIRPDTRSATS